jgi:hypothetical protein
MHSVGSDSRRLLDLKHEKNAKVGQRTLDDKDYEGVNSTQCKSTFLPRGIPRGPIYRGS